MKDYKESLLAGIAAAKQAVDNRTEINNVIEALNKQIFDISEQKSTFGIASLSRKTDIPAINAFIGVAHLLAQRQDKYEALCIFDSNGKNGIEIAEWIQGEQGYPCTIKYNDQKLFCSNKEELENSLDVLLQEVKTGEAILEQIKNHNKNLIEPMS